MKYYLIVASGKHKGMPIRIDVDLFMIGSAKECQLRTKVKGVGERHCLLLNRDRKKFFVQDLNSGEPTTLNGELVPPGEEWPMHAGDQLEVGTISFVVQFREKPLSGRDLEEWALKSLDVAAERERSGDEEEGVWVQQRASIDASEAAASVLDSLQAKRGLVKGRLRIGLDGGVTHVRFNDRYLVDEAEIALVRKELYDNLEQRNLKVVLDFKNVRRMSSVAIKMIDELYSWLLHRGSKLAICRVREALQESLQLLKMKNDLKQFHDRKEAMVSVW